MNVMIDTRAALQRSVLLTKVERECEVERVIERTCGRKEEEDAVVEWAWSMYFGTRLIIPWLLARVRFVFFSEQPFISSLPRQHQGHVAWWLSD
jgi:type VI protein secretion system component VasA